MTTKKHLILLILKLLEANSDEEHPITQTKLTAYINSVFPCDRKTVGRNIQALRRLGYPIQKTTRGFYLTQKVFSLQEKQLVLSAISSSAEIKAEDKEELMEKIGQLMSKTIYRKKKTND